MMISVSLLVVLLGITFIAIKFGKAKVPTMVLGVCLGLALASTDFGIWGVQALNDLLNQLAAAANEMAAGA